MIKITCEGGPAINKPEQHIKHNQSRFNDALLCEAEGLNVLRQLIEDQGITIRIPQVYAVNQERLVMEVIKAQPAGHSQWQHFGQQLARLHEVPMTSCGYHQNNHIGLNPQINTVSDDWGQFFYQHRLCQQLAWIKNQEIQTRWTATLSRLATELTAFLNQQTSQFNLLHGDLWSGNVLFDAQQVWLIDPAVYHGDAEVDLAMTELFGGFPQVFYQAYAAIRPISTAYPIKRQIYNLYHLLNHYNLFGDSYLQACQRTLNQIESELAAC